LYGDLTVASVLKFTHTVTERLLRYVVIDARADPDIPDELQASSAAAIAAYRPHQFGLAGSVTNLFSGNAANRVVRLRG
jgi:hypothetical protein